MMQPANLNSIIIKAGKDALSHQLDVINACW
jgi:hypothetical protein